MANYRIVSVDTAATALFIDWDLDGKLTHHPIPEVLLDGATRTEEEISVIIEALRPAPVTTPVPDELINMVFVTTDPVEIAKEARDHGQYDPIVVNGRKFDAHSEARNNIFWSNRKFPMLDAELRGDGTLDWTLYDGSIYAITLAELTAVEDALVMRKAYLHAAYTAAKNA